MREKRLIQFYITDQCNSACKTCNIWRKRRDFIELPVESIMEVVLSNLDADFVIGGGEAILHSEIETLLSELNLYKINYTLLTNCIDYERLFSLIYVYEVPNVTISYDGMKHDSIRGIRGNESSIKKVVGYIEFLNAQKHLGKVGLKLSYTLSKYNEDNFIQDMDYIKNELHMEKVYFCLAQQMELLKTGEPNFVVDEPALVVLPRADMLYEKDNRLLFGPDRPCDSTGSVFTIYNSGDVVRCQSFKSDEILGNIYKQDFNEIAVKAMQPYICNRDYECKLVCQRRYD